MKQKDLNSQQNDNFSEIKEESFVELMQQEREIKMNLSFDDFMKKVEEDKPIVNRSSKSYNLNWVTSLAACLLIVFGCIYFFKSENIKKNPIQKNVEIVKHDLVVKEETQGEVITKDENSPKEEIESSINLVKNNSEVSFSKTKTLTKSKLNNSDTELAIKTNESYDELVVVNGERVEDEQKAQQITLDALKLFAMNMDKGSKAVGELKKLAVEY
jgi:hypothetical protein